MLKAPLQGRVDPEAALESLLGLIPDLSSFSRLPGSSEVQVTFTLYGITGRPSLWLSGRAIHRLALIGASLDVDTYDLSEVDESATEAD